MAAAFMAETVYRESRRSSLRIAQSRHSLGRHAVIEDAGDDHRRRERTPPRGLDDALRQADALMCEAKREGKGRLLHKAYL